MVVTWEVVREWLPGPQKTRRRHIPKPISPEPNSKAAGGSGTAQTLSIPSVAETSGPVQSGLALLSSRNSVTLASVSRTLLPVVPDRPLTAIKLPGTNENTICTQPLPLPRLTLAEVANSPPIKLKLELRKPPLIASLGFRVSLALKRVNGYVMCDG